MVKNINYDAVVALSQMLVTDVGSPGDGGKQRVKYSAHLHGHHTIEVTRSEHGQLAEYLANKNAIGISEVNGKFYAAANLDPHTRNQENGARTTITKST